MGAMTFVNLHNLQGLNLMVRVDHIMAINEGTAKVKVPKEEVRELGGGDEDEKCGPLETEETKEVAVTQLVMSYGTSLVVAETIEQVANLMDETLKNLQRLANQQALALPPGAFKR